MIESDRTHARSQTLLVFVGPKGSGKSHCAEVVERALAIPYVRAEPLAMAVAREIGTSSPDYERACFARIEAEVERRFAEGADLLAFDTTGASAHAISTLDRYRERRRVVIARVEASTDTCLVRIRARDAAAHVALSDARIADYDALARAAPIVADVTVANDPPATDDAITDAIRRLLGRLIGTPAGTHPTQGET